MRFLSGGEKKSQRPDLTFTSTCPVQIVMCSVGIQEEIGHFSVSSASLVWLNLYGTLATSVYKHAHISMHAQLSHCLGGKGKARPWLYHCQSTKKKIGEAIPNLRSHQPTNTRRWADVSQFEHKNHFSPLFSTYFVNLCQRLGTYHSFKNGCGGLGSEHTSVVCTAIFFPFFPESRGVEETRGFENVLQVS